MLQLSLLVAALASTPAPSHSFGIPKVVLWPVPTTSAPAASTGSVSAAAASAAAAASPASGPGPAPPAASEEGAETSTASLTLNQASTPPAVTLWEALPAPEAPPQQQAAWQAPPQAQAAWQATPQGATPQAAWQAQPQASQFAAAAAGVLGTHSVGTGAGLVSNGIPSLVSGLSKQLLTLIPLSQSYPEAICNDGTTAGYYFQAGLPGSTDWIIYLEGGMWCWSEASCIARCKATPFECSSSSWTHTMALGGIFAVTKVNPWAHANKAYLSYCSSDAWIGDVDASAPGSAGFAYKGQAIIEAAISDMTARMGLNGNSNVLFGGCSAGARGAMFNLDYVGAMLPAGSTVRGMLDSPLWLDLTPPDSAEVSLQAQTQGVMTFMNPGARIPAACAAAYPGSEGWKCLYGQYRIQFTTTPYFINAAQFDSFQMLYDLGGEDPATSSQVYFADQFQSATIAALQPAVSGGQGVFSTSCCVHCLSVSSAMATYMVNGQNMLNGAGQWYFNNSKFQQISSCKGYDCVFSCPPTGLTGQAQAEASQAEIVANGGQLPAGASTTQPQPAAAGPAAGPAANDISGASLWSMSMGRRILRRFV